ncbi:MAG: hypothetical protein QHH06_00545 [Clostridiales bacterium]|nr:hypothetical protein [Eubacteriales bacterium]MDH7564958.1 hypothetical protein [Clostridiales bacterium]
MFDRDEDLLPKTYSIKGYRTKNKISLKRFVVCILWFLLAAFVLGIAFLTIFYAA